VLRPVMAKPPPSKLPPEPGLAAREAVLLAAVGRGDAGAFRLLVDTHLGAMLATARRILGDAAEAEDVAQEGMLRLWRNAARLELGPGGLRPWLRRVVSNLAIDRIRASRNTQVVAEVPEQAEAASQSVGMESRDLAIRVQVALSELPERQRLALVLFHFEGLSQIEIGESLGVSDEAVESLLARARRSLKTSLKDEWQQLLPDSIA
jgi:RNA polymerase sigma-70 factor, ECF subfamily